MKIVVDTNVVFSALLNTSGTIGDLLFNSEKSFEFYGSAYLREEITEHWAKLKKLSKLDEESLQASYALLLQRLNFIEEETVPTILWLRAEEFVADIDEDDADFIALAWHVEGGLWTGDKPLYAGLKQKGFESVFTTAEMLQLRQELEAGFRR